MQRNINFSRKQIKRWAFTDYDMSEREVLDFLNQDFIEKMIVQKEVCPTTRREHWQGYFELTQRKRFQTVKSYFPNTTVHLEHAGGTAWQNYEYCTKNRPGFRQVEGPDGEVMQYQKGEFRKPRSVERKETGTSNLEFIDAIKNGMTDSDLLTNFPLQFLKQSRQISNIRLAATNTAITRPIGTILLTGATGTGKTWCARQYAHWHHGGRAYVLTPSNPNQTTWFDNYQGEKLLIIEDFDGGIQYRRLLTILDHHHSNLEVKGAFAIPRWEEVIITSNLTPNQWYTTMTDMENHICQLERRIHHTITMEPGEWASEKWNWKFPIPKRVARVFEHPPAQEAGAAN